MDNQTNMADTKAGTVGGVALVMLLNIQPETIFNTIVQAAVAAAVRFD